MKLERRPLFGGNWKMHKVAAEAETYCKTLDELVGKTTAEVVIFPSPPLLHPVAAALEGSVMARPTDNSSTSIFQPLPAISGPPMMKSSGTKTSLPDVGPFWNGIVSGL